MTNSGIPISDDRLVWYAVYGSNLLRKRFDCYIQGGKPKGATKEYPGCRDKTAPREARRVVIAHSLYFAEHSESWDGAIAFIRRTVSDARTYGRMYLIAYGQFNDVIRQENGRDVPGPIVVPSFEALAQAKETYPCMRKSKILDYLGRTQGIREAIPVDTLTGWVFGG